MNSKQIGEILISLRGEKTQQQVADDLGITVSAVGMYERGQRIPRDEVKLKIAEYYHTSVQSIFFDSNDTLRVKKEE